MQLASLGDDDIQNAERVLQLERERIQLQGRIESSTDKTLEGLRQQDARLREMQTIRAKMVAQGDTSYTQLKRDFHVRERMLAIENELKDLGNPTLQAQRSKLEVERERLKIIDEIAEIEESRGNQADVGDLMRQDIGPLKDKLKLLEQEKSLRNEVHELQRVAAPGADLRSLQDTRARLDNVRELGDEQARLEHIMNSPAILRQMRQQESMRQQIRLSTRTWRDYVSQYAEILEKTDSSIQVWFTLGMVIEKAWTVFLNGSISAAIEDANAKLGDLSRTSEIVAQAGGLLTERQAGSASLRAAELGISKDTGKLAGLSQALAGRSVLMGESTDMGQAAQQALQQLQEEFARGELGQSFKDLGVSVSQYDDAVRRAAAQRGVLPEALDLQTRQQILLAQATKDSTTALALYSAEQVRGGVSTKNFLNDVRDSFGQLVSGNAMHEFTVASKEAQIEALKKPMSLKGNMSANALRHGAEFTDTDAEEGRRLALREAQASLEKIKEVERLAATRALKDEMGKQLDTILLIGGEGAQEVLRLTEMLRLTKEASIFDIEKLNALDAMASKSGLMTSEMLAQLKAKVGQKGIDELILELESKMLPAQIKATEAHLAGAKARAEGLKFAEATAEKTTSQIQQETKRDIARLDFQQQFLKYQYSIGATADEANERLKSDRIQQMMLLEGERAINAEKKALTYLMTENQKKQEEARDTVFDVKQQLLGASDNMEMFNREMGRAVAVQAFSKISDDGQLLLEKLIGGKAELDGMVVSAGRLAGALNNLSGGKLFGDKFLEKLFMKGDEKKDQSGSGKGKGGGRSREEDDLLEQLRRQKVERDIAAAAYSAREQAKVTFMELDRVRGMFAPQLDNPLALDFLFGADFDAELATAATQLEWWYLDTMKQAKGRAAEVAAVEAALQEKLTLLQQEASRRQWAAQVAMAKEAYGEIKAEALDAWGQSKAAYNAYAENYLYTTRKIADMQAETVREAMLSGATSGLDLSLSDVTGARKLSDNEKGIQGKRVDLQAQLDAELKSHRWTLDQKLMLEAEYQRRLKDIDQEYARARYEENDRLRKLSIDAAAAALQESQELMSKFSDEARSMSEGSQATFQGGMTQLGKDAAYGLDIATVSAMSLINAVGEVDKALTLSNEENANSVEIWAKSGASMLSASGKFADSMVKDEKKKAWIKGAVHSAEAIGSFAAGDVPGGVLHGLAAAKFFTIAGSAQAAPGKAKKAEATKKTALSANTVALSRDRGPSVVTNVFVTMAPLTGQSIVRTINAGAGSMRGEAIDSRWTRPTASVRRDL